MYCLACGEMLEGNGHNSVIRCPNIKDEKENKLIDTAPPDSGPYYCGPIPYKTDNNK